MEIKYTHNYGQFNTGLVQPEKRVKANLHLQNSIKSTDGNYLMPAIIDRNMLVQLDKFINDGLSTSSIKPDGNMLIKELCDIYDFRLKNKNNLFVKLIEKNLVKV